MTTTHTDPRGLLTPGDQGFDAACRSWNLNAPHRPAAVVLAEHEDDVRDAVRFARASGLGVGVMSTGHGTTRATDGGVLVNTSRLRGVEVDPGRLLARVRAGARWTDLIAAAAPHGLTGLPGSSPGVGVVGFALGGGFGWLGRQYGLAAHSIARAEVVTADGRTVVAGPQDDTELLWGLMGGTDNFGLVTSLELQLHPLAEVYGGSLYYPLERTRELLSFFAEWNRDAPTELTAAATFRSFPALPVVPHPLRGGSFIAVRGAYCGDVCEGERLLDQVRSALGDPTVDTFTRMPVPEMARISMDPVDPLGALSRTEMVGDLTPGLVDALVELVGPGSRSPLVMLELRRLGGALAGPVGALSPMARTEAAYTLNAIGITPTPEHADAVRRHLARLADVVRPHATGETYLNFLDLAGATPDRVRAAYSEEDWARLVRLKRRLDPDNVFRFNRNIPPGTTHPEGEPS